MDAEEQRRLRGRVAQVKANTVAPRSRAVYQNSYCGYVVWLLRTGLETVCSKFRASLGEFPSNDKDLRKLLKGVINGDKGIPPIDFTSLEVADFVSWLLTLETPDGEPLSYSAMNTHRVGLFNLFRDYGKSMTKEMADSMAAHSRGLKREAAERARDGEAPVETGKDLLSFGLYKFLCNSMIKSDSKEMVFARASLIIVWHLMCRSLNTFAIRYSHMEWAGDAMRIYFTHMKNDQAGERPRDPRHVYDNPSTLRCAQFLHLECTGSC